MTRVENIIIGAGIGGLYGATNLMWRAKKGGRGIPPLRMVGREALSEATEWAGAMFMTEMMISGDFPQDIEALGNFLTVALWLEAIFPRIIGER